jgi:hypothetical protein
MAQQWQPPWAARGVLDQPLEQGVGRLACAGHAQRLRDRPPQPVTRHRRECVPRGLVLGRG